MLFRVLILILLICSTDIASHAQKNELKQFRKEHSDFVYLPTSMFTMGNMPEVYPMPADSNLQLVYDRRLECVDGFLMCDHEVTNGEYREFVNYVKDSVMRAALAQKFQEFYLNGKWGRLNFEKEIDLENKVIYDFIMENFYDNASKDMWYNRDSFLTDKLIYSYSDDTNNSISMPIYPDTTVWHRGSGSEFLWANSDYYFWHPAYGDFPVVGLRFEQAFAYTRWKSYELHKRFPSLKVSIELPNENEWECAALLNIPPNWDVNFNGVPCSIKGYAVYSDFKYNNGRWKVDYCERTDINISAIQSKAKGFAGFYDLAGNVAEYVKITEGVCGGVHEEYGHNWYNKKRFPNLSISIYENDNLESIKLKILIANADTLYSLDPKRLEENLEEMASILLHDFNVKRKFDSHHIIRGGSWCSPMHHCLPEARVWVQETHADRSTGFRIVIHAPEDVLMTFVKK
jgi:formylglycine-generating enzyme required for sulfatase activity